MADGDAFARDLAAWDRQVLDRPAPGVEVDENVLARGTVLRQSCPDEAIARLERTLGVSLPPSYRRFLALSDGAHADPEGVLPVGIEHPSSSIPPGYGFLPAEHVAWLADAEPELVDMWLENFDAPGDPLAYDGADVSDIFALRRGALLIGSAADGFSVLVRASKAKEWQLWTMQKELVVGYRSFRSWLRFVVHSLRAQDIPVAVERLRAGDVEVDKRLRRIRDTAAVPLLADYLAAALSEEEPSLTAHTMTADARPTQHSIVTALIGALFSIGTEEAAAALEPVLRLERSVRQRLGKQRFDWTALATAARHASAALWQMNNPVATDLLAMYGKHEELRACGDPRAAEAALAALTPPDYEGAVTLAKIGDPDHLPALVRAAEEADDLDAQYRIAISRLYLGDRTALPDLRAVADDPNHPRHDAGVAKLRTFSHQSDE